MKKKVFSEPEPCWRCMTEVTYKATGKSIPVTEDHTVQCPRPYEKQCTAELLVEIKKAENMKLPKTARGEEAMLDLLCHLSTRESHAGTQRLPAPGHSFFWQRLGGQARGNYYRIWRSIGCGVATLVMKAQASVIHREFSKPNNGWHKS